MEKLIFEDYPSTKTPISADNLNKMQDNIESEISKTIIYDTKSTNSNFTTSEPFSDFTYVKIYFHSVLGYRNSVEVLSNATLIPLNTSYRNSGSGSFEVVGCELSISGSNVTMQNFYIANNGSVNDTSNKYIYVDKIIGFK